MTPDEVADRLEIDQLLTAYAEAVDTGNWDGLDAVFTPDATIDYTSAGGIAGGLAEVKAWLATTLPMFAVRQHLITNVRVDVDDEGARVRCYLFNPMGTRDESGALSMFFVGGGYDDRAVRTADGWRLAQRTHVTDWMWTPATSRGRSGPAAP